MFRTDLLSNVKFPKLNLSLETTKPHIADNRLLIRSKLSSILVKNFVVLSCLLFIILKRVAKNDSDERACQDWYLVSY